MDKINRNNYEAYFLDFAEGNLSDEQRKEVLDFIRANPDLREELEEFELIQLPVENEEPENWVDLKKDYSNSQELRDELYFKAVERDLSEEDEKSLSKLLENQAYAEEYKLWKSLKLTPSDIKGEWSSLYQIGPDKEITETNFDHFLIAASEGLLTEEQESHLERLAAEIPNGKNEWELAQNLRLKAQAAVFYPDKDKLYKKKERAGLLIWFSRAAAVAALFILGYFIIGQFQNDPAPRIAEKMKVDSTKTKPLKEKGNQSNDAGTGVIVEEDTPDYTGQEENSKKNDEAESVKPESFKKSRIDVKVNKLKPIPANAIEQSQIADFGSAIALRTEALIQTKKEVKQIQTVEPDYDDYQTLPELAEDYLASRFDYTDNSSRGFVPTMAQKIAERAGEALDAEVKTEENQTDDRSKFTFRVGNFKVTRSSTK